MTIAYIANVRLPTQKAHGYQIMKMCEALAQQGISVELVVPRRKRFIADDPFVYWAVARAFRIVELPTTDFISWRTVPRKIAFLIDAASFAFQVFRYTRKKRDINAVFTRDREIAFLSAVLKMPMIFEIHFLPRALFLYKIFWRRLRKMVTITNALKFLLVNAGFEESRIVVLPDAVDLKLFSENIDQHAAREKLQNIKKDFYIPENAFVVLYAGQLFAWKGVETLAKIFSWNEAGTAHNAELFLPQNVFFVIVGGEQSTLDAFKPHFGENVLFAGQRPASEIPLWLRAADVLILPNSKLFKISELYTSPLKLFEYMASGVPMVVSKLPSLEEIVSEKEAFFFEPDNASSLAGAIVAVRNNYIEAKKRAARAREKVKQYTWENRARRIYDILGNV